MSLEPAIALVIGIVVLHQVPTALQWLGIACVVAAGIAAERSGQRDDEVPDLETRVAA
jgi:inner membrane transporter RhtA